MPAAPPAPAPPRPVVLLCLLLVLLPACATPAWRSAPVTTTQGGAVACVERHAAEAGAAVLARGGNAADAAVACALALAVTWPPAGNLGGGGLALVREPDGQASLVDFRETAPAAVDAGLFLGPDGAYDPALATDPYRTVGVPGSPAGLALLHARHGALPWAEVVEPARRLAAEGFPVDASLAAWLAAFADELAALPSSAAVFLGPDGSPPAAGERLVQPDLAATLARLADEGPDGFYRGPVGDALVAALAAGGGLLGADDLAGYEPVLRRPLRLRHGDAVVLAAGPPSSGGVALGQLLGLLERWDAAAAPLLSADELHLFAEAGRRAFADRATWLGDPDFSDVPVERLLSDDHLDALAADLDRRHAGDSADHGPPLSEPPPDRPHTTHLSVVDREGRAVSLTTTLEQAFGSKLVAAGTGVLLNDQLRDFNRIPGRTLAAGHIGTGPNLPAPGKRPLTSMTPVIVERDGHLALVTGSPGGRTIISTVARVLLAHLDRDLPLDEAVGLPRVHHGWWPDQLAAEPGGLDPAVRAALRERGHRVVEGDPEAAPLHGTQGCANSVAVDPDSGLRTAVGDPRRHGWTAAVDP